MIRAVYIWKCPECEARLRVLAEIAEDAEPERSTVTCPVCLRKRLIDGKIRRVFMDGEDNKILDVLGFQESDGQTQK